MTGSVAPMAATKFACLVTKAEWPLQVLLSVVVFAFNNVLPNK